MLFCVSNSMRFYFQFGRPGTATHFPPLCRRAFRTNLLPPSQSAVRRIICFRFAQIRFPINPPVLPPRTQVNVLQSLPRSFRANHCHQGRSQKRKILVHNAYCSFSYGRRSTIWKRLLPVFKMPSGKYGSRLQRTRIRFRFQTDGGIIALAMILHRRGIPPRLS